MGTAVVGALRAVLGLDTAAFEAGLDQAQKELAKAGKEFEKLGSRLTKVGAGLSIGLTLPLVAFGKKSVDAFDESAKAVAGVEAALRSMGAQAGFTSQQLQDMAAGLQKNSPFDDDTILNKVTANLLTFGKVQGEVFKRAQQSAVDMSARLGEDLQASAIRVGKALNDPIKGLTALQRVGVSFTTSQKAVIAQMVKTGDVAGAQTIILKELEREFGGQAQALAKTDWGRQQVAMNAFNDAMEDVGKTIRAIMPDVAKAIQAVADAFLGLPPAARQAIVVGAAMAAALGPLLTAFGGVVAIVGKLGTVLAGAASSTGLLAGAMRVLSAAVVFMGPWALAIGAAAAALGLLYLGMRSQQAASKDAKQAQDGLNTAVSAYEKAALAAAIATGKAREEALKDVASKREQVRQTLAAAQAKLAEAKATLVLREAQLASESDKPADASDPGNIASVVAANRLLRAEANVKLLTASIDDAERRMADADKILNAKPPALAAVPSGATGKARKGADPAKAAERQHELADLRAQYDLERQITEAEAAGDDKRAQALQDQLYLQERIDAWRRAGLSDIGALIKAEQDLTAKQAMRTAEARKEWQQRNVAAIQAGAQAAEEARQKAMENSERLAQLRLEHELDIARIEGDPQRIAALEREMEIARKTAEYRAAGMGDIDAVLQASTDANQEEAAKKKAVFRDAIKGGFQAALEGDFKGWFRSWMAERLTHAWEDSLNKLADSIMGIFRKIDWGSIFGGGSGSIFGSGPGGGGLWDTFKSGVGDILSSVFSGAPALAGGGSFMVGGRGGVDRNFVGLNLTRGERVDVTPAGHQANGVRPGLVFAPTYNVTTPDVGGFRRTQRQLINEQKRALDRGYF